LASLGPSAVLLSGGGGRACVNHGLCAVCDRAEFRVVFVYNVFLAPINCAGALSPWRVPNLGAQTVPLSRTNAPPGGARGRPTLASRRPTLGQSYRTYRSLYDSPATSRRVLQAQRAPPGVRQHTRQAAAVTRRGQRRQLPRRHRAADAAT
jgi:hypothetical protein